MIYLDNGRYYCKTACLRQRGCVVEMQPEEEEEKEDVVDAERRLGGKAMHIYVSASMMF